MRFFALLPVSQGPGSFRNPPNPNLSNRVHPQENQGTPERNSARFVEVFAMSRADCTSWTGTLAWRIDSFFCKKMGCKIM